MKKLLILGFIFCFAGVAFAANDEVFNVTMHLDATIMITETHALDLGPEEAGYAANYVIGPLDANAAQFNITGEPNATLQASVQNASIVMTNAANNITVDTFIIDVNQQAGFTGDFNGSGAATVQVGATAHVEAIDAAGNYTGTNTLNVVYF